MPRRRLWALAMARVALAVVGVAQVVITGRLLMSGDIDSFRDLGAMGVALGVGFLVGAFQPYRAIGLRPIVVTAALLLVGSALVDLTHHRTTPRRRGSASDRYHRMAARHVPGLAHPRP